MMNLLQDFGVMLLTAVVLQNAVFTRGLGASRDTLMLSSPRGILLFGAALSCVSFFSSLLAWPLNYLLREHDQLSGGRLHLRFLFGLGCVCVVFALLYLVSRAYFPRLHYHLRRVLLSASFNCAVLGSMLIAFSEGYSLVKTLGFALGSGIGYTLALLLIYEGRRRIALSDVPRSFRGLPVTLLYLGIFSLAVYGLIGHQLPT